MRERFVLLISLSFFCLIWVIFYAHFFRFCFNCFQLLLFFGKGSFSCSLHADTHYFAKILFFRFYFFLSPAIRSGFLCLFKKKVYSKATKMKTRNLIYIIWYAYSHGHNRIHSSNCKRIVRRIKIVGFRWAAFLFLCFRRWPNNTIKKSCWNKRMQRKRKKNDKNGY